MNNGVQSCWEFSEELCGMYLRVSTEGCKLALGVHRAKLPGREEDRGAVCVGIVHDGKPTGG